MVSLDIYTYLTPTSQIALKFDNYLYIPFSKDVVLALFNQKYLQGSVTLWYLKSVIMFIYQGINLDI